MLEFCQTTSYRYAALRCLGFFPSYNSLVLWRCFESLDHSPCRYTHGHNSQCDVGTRVYYDIIVDKAILLLCSVRFPRQTRTIDV